ncbi:DUF6597 domain-containing transcriptional factor [Corynebacterium marambiense]|uniref:DUF6597 domain-containing transcriptional factor n=1 Tax=Corynebacterium marambiense TaxID=2765364 RepID=UPI00361CC268
MSTWAIDPGRHSAQDVLAFPASNLAFQEDEGCFWGPTSRCSTRVLVGQSWVLGALLRPAAAPIFTEQPGSLP